MSKARVGATLMVISLAAFALNCGVAATAPGIRLDVGSNPDPGTPSNPSASSDTFADLQLDSHWSGYVLLPPAYKSVPNYHEFTYEVYFYGEDLEKSQALEFDINQFFNGMSFIWGHECRIAGGHEWDTWDNVNKHWVKSGIPCNPLSNAWNHLVIQVSRTTDDRLQFKSITLNGVTRTVNRFDHPSATTWYGMTINYQMDGDSEQEPYTVYLDKVRFSYK